MPLYEYQCEKCGHRFEKIQKFSDRMVRKCPECGGKVEQMISAPAVQFKGSGWYVTDYANKPNTSSSGGSDSGGSDKDSKNNDKDSKREEKSKSESTSKDESSKDKSAKEPAKAGASKKSDRSDKHK
jgi:putative FmdB family regulatory protein